MWSEVCMASASLRSLIATWTSHAGLLIRPGFATLGILLVTVSSRGATHSFGAVGQTDEAGKPRVIVLNPSDCPLLISSIDSTRLSAYHFDLGVVVVNTGVLPITSYAIRYSEHSGQSLVGSGFVGADM